MEHKTDKGTAIINANSVTHIDPTIIANTPNFSSLGDQIRPNKNFVNPYSWNAGNASMKMNPNIVKIMKMENSAVIVNPFSIKNSDKLFFFHFRPHEINL